MIMSEPFSFKVSFQSGDGAHHVQQYEVHSPQLPLLPTAQAPDSLPRPPLGKWSQLAAGGDQWFAAHLHASMMPNDLRGISPLAFTAGHALELYLKAAVTAHASFKEAKDLGHRLPKLWNLCEEYPGFPLKGLIQPPLLDKASKIYDQNVRAKLHPELRKHLSENEILYLSLRHVQDLKYLGLPGQTIAPDQYLTFALPVPNKVAIWQLGTLARWVWGEWCCKPGYNGPSLYELANRLLAR